MNIGNDRLNNVLLASELKLTDSLAPSFHKQPSHLKTEQRLEPKNMVLIGEDSEPILNKQFQMNSNNFMPPQMKASCMPSAELVSIIQPCPAKFPPKMPASNPMLLNQESLSAIAT